MNQRVNYGLDRSNVDISCGCGGGGGGSGLGTIRGGTNA